MCVVFIFSYIAGVACAAGDCCNTVTGTFKAAGNLCRTAMHQCDLPDYCSGSNATCGSNVFKPDGTSCTESGPNGKCYGGSCKGLDGQCSDAFQGFTGTWVAHAANGISADCNNMCGELRCTSTDWANYCTTYTCPQYYTCTVAGVQLTGPTTHSYCSCNTKRELTSVITPVMVQDGTPCEVSSGLDKICLNSVCVPRPVPPPPPSPAAVACVGAWGAYSSCSLSCGSGVQSRTFSVTTQASNGGAACSISHGTVQNQPCGSPCPINCVGAWGSWGSCSATCGGGTQIRSFSTITAAANGGSACTAAQGATQSQTCGTTPCPVNCV
eukprot:COSAG01_NODE_14935_length_1393_cov_18.225657_1_plen_325_part_01